MSTARQALALDELLRHPRFPELAAAFRRHAPTAFRDQQEAAIDDAHRAMHVFHAIAGGTLTGNTSDEMPEWIRLGVLDTWARIADGTATTCIHQPTLDRPQPIVAAAWKPGMATCGHCSRILNAPRGSVEDRTCDRCGHVCQPQDGDLIHPCAVQFGQLLYQFGLCRECHTETAVSHPALIPAK